MVVSNSLICKSKRYLALFRSAGFLINFSGRELCRCQNSLRIKMKQNNEKCDNAHIWIYNNKVTKKPEELRIHDFYGISIVFRYTIAASKFDGR